MVSVQDSNSLRSLVETTAPGPRSTPMFVADVLREAILRNILIAGQQLRQGDIARQLGVSHTPVREALRRLEAEGLVRLQPNRGFMVSVLSPEEVGELYEIRIPLECTALRLAMPHLAPEDLAEAEQIVTSMDAETDPAAWCELNNRFHAVLYAPARRERLLALIRTLRTNVEYYLRLYIAVMQRKQFSQHEHRRILEAVRRGSIPEAVAALEEHLDIACRMLVNHLRREQTTWVPATGGPAAGEHGSPPRPDVRAIGTRARSRALTRAATPHGGRGHVGHAGQPRGGSGS